MAKTKVPRDQLREIARKAAQAIKIAGRGNPKVDTIEILVDRAIRKAVHAVFLAQDPLMREPEERAMLLGMLPERVWQEIRSHIENCMPIVESLAIRKSRQIHQTLTDECNSRAETIQDLRDQKSSLEAALEQLHAGSSERYKQYIRERCAANDVKLFVR